EVPGWCRPAGPTTDGWEPARNASRRPSPRPTPATASCSSRTWAARCSAHWHCWPTSTRGPTESGSGSPTPRSSRARSPPPSPPAGDSTSPPSPAPPRRPAMSANSEARHAIDEVVRVVVLPKHLHARPAGQVAQLAALHQAARPDNPVQALDIDSAIPWHACALGHAIVAGLATDAQEALLACPAQRLTGLTVTEPEKLRQTLAVTRHRGYAVEAHAATL